MSTHTIYILSGGVGSSGEVIVNTALAQFPGSQVRVVVAPYIRDYARIDQTLSEAKAEGALVTHTMVNNELRRYLLERAAQEGVETIDLMGPLVEALEEKLATPAIGQPGLYRKLRHEYYERVAAIEYTMEHDDGKNPDGWQKADLLLIGVSRVGKTPTSLYLSVQGWKAANYPLVPGIDPPLALDNMDPQRVFGLTIEPGQLLSIRQERQRRIGLPAKVIYTDPARVYEEVEQARAWYRRRGFAVVNVTDKSIESIAEEILRVLLRHFPEHSRRA